MLRSTANCATRLKEEPKSSESPAIVWESRTQTNLIESGGKFAIASLNDDFFVLFAKLARNLSANVSPKRKPSFSLLLDASRQGRQ